MTPASGRNAIREASQLMDRLVSFGVDVRDGTKNIANDPSARHMVDQLVRAATSVAANYAEACAAESRRDFVHKMHLCLKELREVRVWLEFLQRIGQRPDLMMLTQECSELTAIFVSSIKTAKHSMRKKR